MKSTVPPGLRILAIFCLALAVPLPATANPFQSIGAGIKKAGNALNPFKKKSAPKPAAEPPPPAKPKPTVAKSSKTTSPKKKKPSAAVAKTASATAVKKETKPEAGTADDPDKPAAGDTPADPAAAPADGPAAGDPAPVTPAEIPFGTPVMGRKGLVRSPFAEDQGMVDVTDLPAGAKVKCPFTGKVFRVP